MGGGAARLKLSFSFIGRIQVVPGVPDGSYAEIRWHTVCLLAKSLKE